MARAMSGLEKTGERDDTGGMDGDDFDNNEDDGGGDDEGGGDERPAGGGVVVVVRVLVGVLFLLAAGALGFAFAGGGTPTPTDNSVAAGLARDMTDHHAQAVDMATIVQGRTTDADIRYLATDIALGQTSQMGQMQGWLNVWKLSIGRSGPPMAWMNQSHSTMQMGNGSTMNPSMMQLQANGLMPGMATQAEVNQLRTLPVKQADVLFLKLMIAHHKGGVAMCQVAIDETKVPVVDNLCRTIVASQTLEITQMTQLLDQRS
jgi:uncharacterized protein (DUF305 family)